MRTRIEISVLQNGIYLSATASHYYRSCETCATMESTAGDASSEAVNSEFSGTTTQEQGVGESDRVKYDGNTIFIANNGVLPNHVGVALQRGQQHQHQHSSADSEMPVLQCDGSICY